MHSALRLLSRKGSAKEGSTPEAGQRKEARKESMNGLGTPLEISIFIAGVASMCQMHQQSWAFGLCLGFVWMILLVTGFARFRWRGMWLLVGFPLALCWPLVVGYTLLMPCYNRFSCP
jgi:hypothetical protein